VFGAKTWASSATRTSSPLSRAASPTGKRNGLPTQLPRSLDAEKRARYSRHLLIPEVGVEGQLKLLQSRVLLIGAGGLGSPAGLYLAAAGVGRIGIVDDDRVDSSNLQRQIALRPERLGDWKADSAKQTLEASTRRRGDHVQGADHLGERDSHPRRRLGRDRRRRRQLPDALSDQRCVRLPRHPVVHARSTASRARQTVFKPS